MTLRVSSIIISLAFAVSCATVPPSEWKSITADPKVKIVNSPEVGEESSTRLGAVLVEKAEYKITPTLEFTSDWTLKNETSAIPAFIVIRGTTATFTSVMQNISSGETVECFRSKYGFRDHWNYGKATYDIAFLLCEKNDGNFAPMRAMDRSLNVNDVTYNKIPKGSAVIKKVDTQSERASQVSQLVYGGRTGNSIQLVYREFVNTLSRPSFFQELAFDLTVSKVVEFQSVRLEVLSSTNAEIRFRLLSSF